MSNKEVKTSDEVAAVGVSMKSIAGSGKDGVEIAVQTHFPLDLTEDQMDGYLDLLSGRLARQRVVGEIPALEEAIEKHYDDIKQIKTDTARIDAQHKKDWAASGRKGPVKLTNSNVKQREAVMANIETYEEKVAILEKKLEEALAVRDTLREETTNVANVC
jgi:hypothetical protein